MTDFRDLCDELMDGIEQDVIDVNDARRFGNLLDRARAALAEPLVGPAVPSDEELNTLWNCCGTADEYGHHAGNIFEYARAILARYGNLS